MMTTKQQLIERIQAIADHVLVGIDKEDTELAGWWETSTGAEFGAARKKELVNAIAQAWLEAQLEMLQELIERNSKDGHIDWGALGGDVANKKMHLLATLTNNKPMEDK